MNGRLLLVASFLVSCSGNISYSADNQEYPVYEIKNDDLKVSIYLPDSERGYYRGIRFDWSGMIKQVEYNGHTYFAELKGQGKNHNPFIHDHGVGPCEEFGMNVPLNWDDVAENEPFLKIGVGLLEKNSGKDGKYHFPNKYEIINLFPWQIEQKDKSIIFLQSGECPGGWKYEYQKTVSVENSDPVLKIHHSLKNIGTRIIKTDHYSHNMFLFDNTPVGKNYILFLPFTPSSQSLKPDMAKWEAQELRFVKDKLVGTFWTRVEGHAGLVENNGFSIRSANSSLSVKTDYPLHDYCIYAEKTALCPEPLILLEIKPGESAEWTTTFTFSSY